VIVRDNVCNYEVRIALNVEPRLWIEISQLRWFEHMFRMP